MSDRVQSDILERVSRLVGLRYNHISLGGLRDLESLNIAALLWTCLLGHKEALLALYLTLNTALRNRLIEFVHRISIALIVQHERFMTLHRQLSLAI